MSLQPVREGLRRAVRQDVDRIALVEVNQQRAVGLSFAQREIVDAKVLRRRHERLWRPSHTAQQRVATRRLSQACGETCASSAAKGQSEGLVVINKATRATGPRGNNGREALRKDAPWARVGRAKPLPGGQLEAHGEIGPGEISDRAGVPAMDAGGGGAAAWTADLRLH